MNENNNSYLVLTRISSQLAMLVLRLFPEPRLTALFLMLSM